jgi:2',3'-cyclic-nucleotide 2'-phosphodiesterase (5'-nucleotidase family)
MKMIKFLGPLLAIFLLFSCDPARKSATGNDNGVIEVRFLQMNDVYEITPGSGDNTGGMARVASIRKSLMAQGPTVTVLAGDFISPSVTGTLKYEGKRIRGKQMVETMNALGVDWVVLGNHEFDYDDLSDLQARIDESSFGWLGGNVLLKNADGTKQPFFKNKNGAKEPITGQTIITLTDADGTSVNIGMFGVLINTGRKPWAEYSDWTVAAKTAYTQLKEKTDFVVGLTHLSVEDDKKLLAEIPDLPLIMGGHDHENMLHQVGKGRVAKADANAKTVYIHTLRYYKKDKRVTIKSELKKIDSSIPDEPTTAAVVAKWEKIKTESLVSSGFDPNKKVTELTTPLDCREIIVRNQACAAGKMLTDAMLSVARTKPDCALINSGSVRVDDILTGVLTELDIVRMLPFGGAVNEVEMKGSLLRKTLDTGWGNAGNGGFLQWGKVRRDEAKKQWFINEIALDDKKTYKVILPQFLLTGNEQNMSFLKAAPNADGKGSNNPDIPVIQVPNPSDKTDLRNDIRLAVIQFLRQ